MTLANIPSIEAVSESDSDPLSFLLDNKKKKWKKSLRPRAVHRRFYFSFKHNRHVEVFRVFTTHSDKRRADEQIGREKRF